MNPTKPNPERKNPWFKSFRPISRPRLRLFCFPHAGGSARAYRRWSDLLPIDIEVLAIEMPGRGTRSKDPLITRMNVLLDALEPAIVPLLDRPYAFFGHSMGGRIGFELARKLRQLGRPAPVHLCISGTPAPGAPERMPPIYALPDDQFIAGIRRHGGTPEDILSNPQMLEIVLPFLRADFILTEASPETKDRPLDIPMTAMGGLDDIVVPPEDIALWREQTTRDFSLETYPGGHFFLHTAEQNVLDSMRAKLNAFR